MISKYISIEEAFKSNTAKEKGIKNETSDPNILANMMHVGKLFDEIREHFGVPIAISSFYRCPTLNKAVGGSKTSQHLTGEAIDINAKILGKITNKQIFDFAQKLDFDQLIWEYGTDTEPSWVHISRKRVGKNRKMIFRIK